jgi:hypothetical protein
MVKKSLHPKRRTYGLPSEHLEASLKEIRDEIERLMEMTRSLRALIVEDGTLFRQSFKETLHDRFKAQSYLYGH